MSEATLVALVILIGVFLIMIVTILKAGVNAAIKMWGVMGALTGVAFGAITSFYFTNEANKGKIAKLTDEKQQVQLALSTAIRNASLANNSVTAFATALQGGPDLFPSWGVYPRGTADSLRDEYRTKLLKEVMNASGKLGNIASLRVLENDEVELVPEESHNKESNRKAR